MARLATIDHVATPGRRVGEPIPTHRTAAILVELAGADGRRAFREDRRHIQDRDLTMLREIVRNQTRFGNGRR